MRYDMKWAVMPVQPHCPYCSKALQTPEHIFPGNTVDADVRCECGFECVARFWVSQRPPKLVTFD